MGVSVGTVVAVAEGFNVGSGLNVGVAAAAVAVTSRVADRTGDGVTEGGISDWTVAVGHSAGVGRSDWNSPGSASEAERHAVRAK